MTKMISVLGFLLLSSLSGCASMSHTHCDDNVLAKQISPDGKFVAVLYYRSCANNTAQYTSVNLQEVSNALGQAEIEPVLTLRGLHDITAVWTSTNSLEIQSNGLQDQKAVLTQHESWKTVTISYKNGNS